MKNKGKVILSAALSALTLFSFSGCDGRPPGAPECGGVTDRTDHSAPKKIESRDLTQYYAHFFLSGEWSPGRENCFYTFDVRKDENGVLTATAKADIVTAPAISRPADETLLTALQAIIDAHGLAAQNGYYRVTAGLPPEFQPCHVNAVYASGETLTFTANNNPRAEWAKETYLAFADWFRQRGDTSLLPPSQSFGPVGSCRLMFTEDGRTVSCGPVRVLEENAIDGERLLLVKSVYDIGTKRRISEDAVLFPRDYGEQVRAILSAHDLRAFDYHSVLYRERPEEKHPTLTLHVNFADGKHLYIDTSDAGDIETLRPLLDELFAYHDSLFEEGG